MAPYVSEVFEYIIPFFETFLKCFEKDVEGKENCLREFFTSDKIPPSVIKYAHDKYENFFEVINETLKSRNGRGYFIIRKSD